jgi:hypothetical protein
MEMVIKDVVFDPGKGWRLLVGPPKAFIHVA